MSKSISSGSKDKKALSSSSSQNNRSVLISFYPSENLSVGSFSVFILVSIDVER